MLTVLPPVRLAFLSLCAAAMLPALTSAHAVTTHEIVASFEVPPKLPDGDLVLASDDFLWGTSSEGGAYDLGTVFRISQDGGARETVLSFSGNGARNKGSKPRSSLLSDNAGFLWGVTSGGGEKNSGTIFKVNLMTRALTTVLEFSGSGSSNRGGGPSGGLADDGRGFFWGTTMVGGTWGHGTIFKVSANGGVFTTVVELTGTQTSLRGSQPTARLANDGEGFFWGTTSLGGTNGLGTVFKVHIGTGQMTSVLSFTAEGVSNRGARPNGNLVSDGAGFMWGTTLLGGAGRVGTIFKVNRSTGALTTVLEFTGTTGPYKGAGPSGGLIKDGAGFFWGTTRGGGSTNYGTVFKLDPAAGALTTLYEFPSDGRSLASSQGQPRGGFVSNGAGSLWATSSYGGLNRLGTIFQVHENTGAVTTMAEFSQWKDEPRMPKGEVVSDGAGFFWGTSEEGGADRSGTVFKVDAITGNSIAMAEFTGNGSTTRGASPNAELVSDGLGSFWGTTQAGGAADKGTVFKIDRASGVLTTVVEFGGEGTSTRGARPAAGLISDGAGFFWGTTEEGGNTASGTLFKVEASTGALTTIVDFSGNGPTNKGAAPRARLVLDGNGSLWGTTFGGGAANAGTVFAVNANTGAMMTVVEFTSNGASNRGAGPAAGLTRDGAGLFWGTTSAGGAGNFGTVFKLNANTGALTTVVEFSNNGSMNRGAKPLSSLVDDGSGFFWGTTNAGVTFQRGTVFKVDANTGELTTVVEFTGLGSQDRSGNNPGRGSLLLHTDGNLYGTTSAGGPEGAGTLFRLRPDFTPVAPAVETLLAENTRTTAGLHASVSAGGAATTVEFFLNNQLVGTVPAGSGSAPTGIDLSVTGLSPHTVYTVTTRATNSAGTTLGRELAAITFTTWNAEPNAPAQLEETPEDQPVTFTLGATDADGDPLTYVITTTPTRGVLSGSGPGLTYTPALNAFGSDSFTYTVSDGLTTSSPAAVSLTVNPVNDLPILALPGGPIVVEATSSNGAPVFFAATAEDLEDGPLIPISNPASGAVFGLGDTTVTVQVTDRNGGTAMGNFRVTVRDTTPPGIAPFAPVTLAADDVGKAILPDLTGSVSASDNVSVTDKEQTPAAGTSLPLGVHAVTFVVRDGAGNTSSIQTTVHVAFTRPVGEAGKVATAHTGAPAPGAGQPNGPPAGTVLSTFGVPAISDVRKIAARVTMIAGRQKLAAIYQADGAGVGTLVGFQGGAAPGAGDGATFKSFLDPLLAPGGALAFAAKLQGANAAEDEGVWTDAFGEAGTLGLVLREGGLVPGVALGVKLKSVASLSLRDGELLALVKLLPGHGGVTAADDVALLRLTRSAGGTLIAGTLLLRENAPLLGSKIKLLSVLSPAQLSPGHGRWQTDADDLAKVTLADGRVLILKLAADGSTTALLATGDELDGRTLSKLGLPAGGSAGAPFAVQGTWKPQPGLVTAKEDTALLFSPDGSAWQVFAHEGAPAPGAGGATFASFFEPVVNADGAIAFLATLQGAGVTGTSKTGLWSGAPEAPQLVARLGSPAPDASGAPSTATWSAITSYALPTNPDAGPILIAKVKGTGVTAKNNLGLWALDSSGLVRCVLRTGDPVSVGDATLTLASFTLLNALPGSFGATRSFNATGSVALLATFTNKTQALLRIDLP